MLKLSILHTIINIKNKIIYITIFYKSHSCSFRLESQNGIWGD